MATKKTTEICEIKPIEWRRVKVRLEGDTPLIMHAWSEKAKREMLQKQMKVTKTSARDAKNPVEDFIRSMYWLTPMPTEFTEEAFEQAIADGARFGFPVTAIKQAGISAAYRSGWVSSMAELRGAFFIETDDTQMVEIDSDAPIMREDVCKVGMGTADLRYRGEFRNWSADIVLKYNANGKFSLEQILNILNAGGAFCGIGEWRPERDGQYGQYHVASAE